MKQERLNRLESRSSRIISEFFMKNLKEIERDFGLININNVVISSDLSYLDIYVSSFSNHERLCSTLAQYAQNITVDLNKKIKFLKTPKIRFRYDDSGEISSQIIDTINHLKTS